MEASVVVCEPLKPPRLCHTENQPEMRKTATQKRARGARAVLCAVRAVRLFPSNTSLVTAPPPPLDQAPPDAWATDTR